MLNIGLNRVSDAHQALTQNDRPDTNEISNQISLSEFEGESQVYDGETMN